MQLLKVSPSNALATEKVPIATHFYPETKVWATLSKFIFKSWPPVVCFPTATTAFSHSQNQSTMEREGTSERNRKTRAGYRKRPKFKGNRFTGSIKVKKTECICSETNEDSFSAANLIEVRDTLFTGLAQKQTPSTSAEQSETPKSVSGQKILLRRKLDSTQKCATQSQNCKQYFVEPHGFRFFDLEIIQYVISLLLCPECSHADLLFREVYLKRSGEASFFHTSCQHCHWKYVFYSSKKVKSKFEVNQRLVYAMRSIGKGRKGAAKFCAIMNMPEPLALNNYAKHAAAVNRATKAVAQETMNEAGSELYSASESSGVVETSVSGDGTWQKRGHSSLHGIVNVISMETGKVLDTEVLTQFCKQCSLHEKDKSDHVKYHQWKAEHQSDCKANFHGSSGLMEPKGMENIFSRSAEKHKLLYTEFYSDGDSKSFDSVKDVYKHSHHKEVKRLQCVGHVQKRLGTALRKLKREVKGLGGRGKLTENMINKLQNYYGIAIRSNVGDLKGMKKAIDASFFHCIATKETPHFHVHCPDGIDSWCKYQKDKITKEKSYQPSAGVPNHIIKEVKPVYARLSEKALLEQCLHGKTKSKRGPE